MSTDEGHQERDRFLIALAKFLGKNPTPQDPLPQVLLCERWLLNEAIDQILDSTGSLKLDQDKFNRFMLHCGRRLCTSHFYDYFFKDIQTVEQFEQAVERYRIKAMWLFGNFAYGYKRIATSDKNIFESLIRKTEPIPPSSYEDRPDFQEIEEIPVNDLPLLGYISAAETRDLDMATQVVEALLSDPAALGTALSNLGPEKQTMTSNVLRKHGILSSSEGVEGLPFERLKTIAKEISGIYEPLKHRQDKAIVVGKRNTNRYLTMPNLDVYVATSMRYPEDFIDQHKFIRAVFDDPQVKPLKLRYFDPTLSYVDDRISKGLVEMLMLQRAKVTIYNAGAEDTLGKDSELAATLAQGKAVIVYVPSHQKIVKLRDGREVDLDKRAAQFKVGHPLGLQINIRTGVAHGIIVVRSPEQCARMLRKVMLHERTFTIRHEMGIFLLEETETGSVLRVVSDDPLLTHAFWTYFRHTQPDEY